MPRLGVPPQKYFNYRPNVRFFNWRTGEIGVTGDRCPRRDGARNHTHIWVLYLEPKVYRMRVETGYAYQNYEEIPV